MKILIFLALVMTAFGADNNYNGRKDSASVLEFKADSLKYTKNFSLSHGEDVRIVLKVDDTTSAGFASDAVKIQWGYQTGVPCYDSAGNVDTCYDTRIVIDTMDVDSFGIENLGVAGADLSLTRTFGPADTSNVTGYAYQSRAIVPEWDALIRFWVQGLAGNEAVSDQVVIFNMFRRTYMSVRQK